MSDEYEATYDDELEHLDTMELTMLAMKAFLFVKKNKPEISDEQLLSDILNWFEIMTFGVGLPEVEDVERDVADKDSDDCPPDGGLH